MQSRVILPQNEIVGLGYRTDVLFGQHSYVLFAVVHVPVDAEIAEDGRLSWWSPSGLASDAWSGESPGWRTCWRKLSSSKRASKREVSL
jgi:hypothetical protein